MNTSPSKTPKFLLHSHDEDSIRERLLAAKSQSYLRDFVYGAIDGGVTTFAIVAGVVGANLSTKVILILSFANILADGFSMAASNYLGTKTEQDERDLVASYELEQIQVDPEGEKEEIRQIFKLKGLEGEVLDSVVESVVKNKKEWLNIMLFEEYGISNSYRSPLKSAFSTFISFIVCGLIPVIPYLFDTDSAFLYASITTGVTFFIVGSLKSLWSLEHWAVAGFKTFLLGSAAAAMAFYTGKFIEGWIN